MEGKIYFKPKQILTFTAFWGGRGSSGVVYNTLEVDLSLSFSPSLSLCLPDSDKGRSGKRGTSTTFVCVIVGGLERARVRRWRVSLHSARSSKVIPFFLFCSGRERYAVWTGRPKLAEWAFDQNVYSVTFHFSGDVHSNSIFSRF